MNSEHPLTNGWYFHLDLENQGRRREWFRKDLPLDEWLPVRVPHSFEGPPLNLPGVEGYGWYRLQLRGVPASGDERWLLHFGAVNHTTDVWVNGKSVGRHEGGYTPFVLDITSALEDGRRQTVVVLVDNLRLKPRCPATNFAWSNVGGIHREVKLLKVRGARIQSIRLHDASQGKRDIPVVAHGLVEGNVNARLTLLLSGPYLHGKPAGKTHTARVALDASGSGRLELPATCRWHPNHPYLYRATVELRLDDRLVERKKLTTGFRVVATGGNRFLLNGEPCWVNGMNYLFDFPNRGMLADPRILKSDLHRIKALGANAIRSHFVMHERAYELCDELGLMVWHDIPLYWWCGDLRAIEAMRPQIVEMVDCDYNHPAVVIRNMGNECSFGEATSQRALREVCAFAKRLDPTRLVAICAYLQQEEGMDLGADAILCNFYREHKDKSVGALPKEVVPTVKRLKKIARFFPDKPIFVSEIGFEGVARHRGEVYSTEDFQAAAFQEYWRQLTATGLLAGFAFWCWADYRYLAAKSWNIKTSSPTLGGWGVVSADRRHVKLALETVRRCFASRRGMVRGRPSRGRDELPS